MTKNPGLNLRYGLELLAAGFGGWLLSTQLLSPTFDHFLSPHYGGYDWYESFVSVIDLTILFVSIGLSLALIVHLRHPADHQNERQD